MNSKWITAIVIIFGLLGMFFVLNWPVVIKSLLIFSCVVLIGCVLLQSGKGGGLAAIGGLADQSALGTQTGGVLAKVTYIVGAVFIVSTLLLTKLTLTSMHGTDTLRRGSATSIQHALEGQEDALEEHAGHNHPLGEHADHDHPQIETEVVENGVKSIGGMKTIDVVGEEQKNKVNKLESVVDEIKE